MRTEISIDIDMFSHLPAKAMLVLVTKYRETKRYWEQAEQSLRDHSALFQSLESLDIDVNFDPDLKIIRCSFSGDGPRLGKIWGELRRNGFVCDDRPKKGDTQFSGWFRKTDYPPIVIWFTSTMCRRIQIGTQTVEQPIYETICGDAPEIQSPPPSALVDAEPENDIPF